MYYFNDVHIGKHLIFQFANIHSAKCVDKHLHRNSAIYSRAISQRFFMFSYVSVHLKNASSDDCSTNFDRNCSLWISELHSCS